MADLEEQLSDEEKVRAVGVAEPVGPGASRAPAYQPAVQPPRKGIGLCPPLPFPLYAQVPAPVSDPRPRAGAGLCLACSLRSL